MIIGTFKEIKPGETRVVLTPVEVSELVANGHRVLVGTDTGTAAGFSDEDYVEAGAEIRHSMEEIYRECDFVVKVKELFPQEYDLLREKQIIFACLHPAANPQQVDALLKKKVIAFTAEDSHRYGSPNCEMAGRLGAIMGVYNLLSINGGCGKLVSGVAGVPGINALVLGAGIVGRGATDILASLGASVTLMDINIGVLRQCQEIFPKNVRTALSNNTNIRKLLPETDLVLNCVKWPKHRKNHLITRDMLKLMRKGSVIVDISADVGGAIETYRPTTHKNPTYVVDGIIHYGVDNIPAAAPYTASIAYASSVLPHILSIANNGVVEACIRDGYLRRSLTAYKGILTHEETAVIQNREWVTPEEVLGLLGRTDLDPAPRATSTVDRRKYCKS